MKTDELQQLVNAMCKAYNKVVDGVQKEVKDVIDADVAIRIIGVKEGAEMVAVAMLHTLLHCYGVQADMELGDNVYSLGGDAIDKRPAKKAADEGGEGDGEVDEE